MSNSLSLLQCLVPAITALTLHQLARVVEGLLIMTGRVTMLGVSRWTDKGGSYRTIQRLFNTVIPWSLVFWSFFYQHLFQVEDTYLLVGDESVVTKSGKETYGLDRFFSSIQGKPVKGLSFLTLSLVSLREQRSYPIRVEQVVRDKTKAEKKKIAPQIHKGPRKKAGRPKGSKNRNKRDQPLSDEMDWLNQLINKQLQLMKSVLTLSYLILDGHYGHYGAVQVAQQNHLFLVSKLRVDSALHFPYQGTDKRQKYGTKINYNDIPVEYLKNTSTEEHIRTQIYQMPMRHKEFADLLNVVIIRKTNLKSGAQAHAILFSSDLNLAYDKVIAYYSLRFQIEFNFRDAKQYWGLEDFMNITKTGVTNAANLSLFMVNVSQVLLRELRPLAPEMSVLDLKAHYRGRKYVAETLKMLVKKPDDNLVAQIFQKVARLGSIHAIPTLVSTS